MPDITVMSWNIEKFGAKKLSKAPFLADLIARMIVECGADILVILELQSGSVSTTLPPIVTLLNAIDAANWASSSIAVDKQEAVGFIWRGSVVQPVQGQVAGTFVSDVICTGPALQPLYFPETSTSWRGVATARPRGRRPAYMMFRDVEGAKTPFIVAGLHAPFDSFNSIQSFACSQYGRARQTLSVPLNNATQRLLDISQGTAPIEPDATALLKKAGINWTPEQIEAIANKIVINLQSGVAYHEKLFTYDGTLWTDLLQNAPLRLASAPWMPVSLANAKLLMLQTVAVTAATLSRIWSMSPDTATDALNAFVNAPALVDYTMPAGLNIGESAVAMANTAAVTNPFADAVDTVQSLPVEYCLLAGDFNVDCPDTIEYKPDQRALLNPAGGLVANANAYTTLSTAPNAGVVRRMAFRDTPTTSTSVFDTAYQYAWNQDGYDELEKVTEYDELCAALKTLRGRIFCGQKQTRNTVITALTNAGLPTNYIDKYNEQIDSVFPWGKDYNNTTLLRVSSYDNFGCQCPAGVADPFLPLAPDVLSKLGSWKQETNGTCTWAAAENRLTAVVENWLKSKPLIVGKHTVVPNLPDVNDAAMFYKLLVSDHYPVTVRMTLP